MDKKRIDRLRDDLRKTYAINHEARANMKASFVLELIAEIDRMRPIVERVTIIDNWIKNTPYAIIE